MPLFIPVVLIGIGIAAGGGGAALGGKGALEFKQARDQVNQAKGRYDARRATAESRVTATNDRLAELGEQQKQCLLDVVLRMGDFLRRHERQVRDSERLLVDGIDASMTQVHGLRRLDVNTAEWLGGALGAVGVFAGTGSGVTAAVGSVGVASTGTAITGLSGAAATNAGMAFLGGGSLAAGGGGMALGAVALNFVTIGPALLVGGLVVKGQGDKALTQARDVEARVNVGIAEMDAQAGHLDAVDARADELSAVLREMGERAVAALDLLESEPFEPAIHAQRFQHAMTLVVGVRDIAAAAVVDADGDLTDDSATVTIKYRRMTEETADA